MLTIKDIKKRYPFFSHMDHLEIIERQRENKENKFFLKNDDHYFVLCCNTSYQNKKFLEELSLLQNIFPKQTPHVLFCDVDYQYLVTEYVGNGNGLSFFEIENQSISVQEETCANLLKDQLEKLHHYPVPKNNIDWYHQQYTEFYRHTKILYQLKILDKNECNIIMAFLRQNRKYLQEVPLTYIHGDLTPRNCCFNFNDQTLYLIDFDMFQIGDPFIDTQKIIWTKHQSQVFETYVKKYCLNYSEDIYLLYWLKIKLYWLPFAYRKKVDYTNPLLQTKNLIKMAHERLH